MQQETFGYRIIHHRYLLTFCPENIYKNFMNLQISSCFLLLKYFLVSNTFRILEYKCLKKFSDYKILYILHSSRIKLEKKRLSFPLSLFRNRNIIYLLHLKKKDYSFNLNYKYFV